MESFLISLQYSRGGKIMNPEDEGSFAAISKAASRALPRPVLDCSVAGDESTQPLWIKKELPPLPAFRITNQVMGSVRFVKSRLYENILRALPLLFWKYRIKQPNFSEQQISLTWIVACLTKKYGRIYLINRREAKQAARSLNQRLLFDEIDKVLLEFNLPTKAINCAVFLFLEDLKNLGRLKFSSFELPQFSFLSASRDAVYVNEEDVNLFDLEMIVERDRALYDLHDFAHYCCALMNADLYGSKMFQGFDRLSFEDRDFVLSPDFLNPDSNKLTDNFLFRQISLYSFDRAFEHDLDEAGLTRAVTEDMYAYLLCERDLVHPQSGRVCRPLNPPTVSELALLAQNKCYEHSASEFEEQVFIRSGPDEEFDPLMNLPTVEFLNSSALDILNYHELRNFVRHRALRNAYIKYAERLIAERTQDSHLAKIIKSFLEFDPDVVAKEKSLYCLVHELSCRRN